jgi:hypothetical protein
MPLAQLPETRRLNRLVVSTESDVTRERVEQQEEAKKTAKETATNRAVPIKAASSWSERFLSRPARIAIQDSKSFKKLLSAKTLQL